MKIEKTSFVFACLCFFTVTTSFAQDVVQLGKNPETGLEEIQVNISGQPEDTIPLVMVLIPAGTFTMGSPSNEKDRDSNEGPQHEVTISQPFYMCKYEVTQAQWEVVMGSNPSHYSGHPNAPVEQVSWNDCMEFVEKMNGLGLGNFRLPTESEWEYSCRAETSTRFYWGDDLNYSEIKNYAWYRNNTYGQTHDVGSLRPNAWGLFDMSGGFAEWCQDYYGDYSQSAATDPQGPSSGSYRVARGGAWLAVAKGSRSASRHDSSPDTRYYAFGLRLQRLYDTSIVGMWDRL